MVEVVLTVPHASCQNRKEQVCDQTAIETAKKLSTALKEYKIKAHIVEAEIHRAAFLVTRTSFGECFPTGGMPADENRFESVALALRKGGELATLALRKGGNGFHQELATILDELEKKEKMVILLDVHSFEGSAFGSGNYNLVLLSIKENRTFNLALKRQISTPQVPVLLTRGLRGSNAIIDMYSNIMPTALLEFRNTIDNAETQKVVNAIATAVHNLKPYMHRCTGLIKRGTNRPGNRRQGLARK